jgi:hypothetical protein
MSVFPGLMEEYWSGYGEIESFAGQPSSPARVPCWIASLKGCCGFSVLEPGAAAVESRPMCRRVLARLGGGIPARRRRLKYTRRDATIQVQLRHPTTRRSRLDCRRAGGSAR